MNLIWHIWTNICLKLTGACQHAYTDCYAYRQQRVDIELRQLGMMVYALLNNITGSAYHQEEPTGKSNPLKGLVKNGEFSSELHVYQSWDPKQDTCE